MSPNYQNTTIFKIACNDKHIEGIFIGNTTNIPNYRECMKSPTRNKTKMGDYIAENGGWDNWNLVEISM
jgi:hypothetical protein